jgi:hypothetical protein
MTTEELVKRLVQLVNEGKNLQAEEELYSHGVVSIEQDGTTAVGLEAVMAKTKAAGDMFEAFHGGGVKTAFVGKDSFLLEFSMDVTPKGGTRMQMEESGFYEVQNGKVVKETFFMQALSL